MSRRSYSTVSPVVHFWTTTCDITSARPDAPVRSDSTLGRRLAGRVLAGRMRGLTAAARLVGTGYRSAGRGGRDVVGAPMWSK